MSNPHDQPLDATIQEQLTAYLDGELDAENSRRVEEMLASDPRVRAHLQGLDRTWELLEQLDTAPLREGFAHTTLEMVAVEAAKDAEQAISQAPQRHRRRRLLTAAGLLAAGVAGFFMVATLLPDPNRQLLDELPLLENLDQYRQIDNIEFLRRLDREKVFADDGKPAPDIGAESPAERRKLVAAMDPAEKDQLLRRQQQFQGLDATEQARVSQLHEQIEHDPDAQKLRNVMARYSQWLAALPSYGRSTILEQKDLTQRINDIKQLRAAQTTSPSRQLSAADRAGLQRWMDRYAQQQESHILEAFPEARQRLAKENAATRHSFVLARMCQQWQSPNFASLPPLSDATMADLRSELSPATRAKLEKKSPADQWQTISGWLHDAAHQRLAARRGEGSLLSKLDEQMTQFFEHQLTDEQRDHLLSLPGDEMQERLRQMYLMQAKPGDFGHRPDHEHGPRGRKPGPYPPWPQKGAEKDGKGAG